MYSTLFHVCVLSVLQASMLTCKEEATLPSSSPEVFQTQLSQLNVTKLMLEEELIKFQAQVIENKTTCYAIHMKPNKK